MPVMVVTMTEPIIISRVHDEAAVQPDTARVVVAKITGLHARPRGI